MDNSGAIWVKSGADKRRVTSKEELRRLFRSSDLVYSDDVPVSGSSLADLDKDYFQNFYEKEFEEKLELAEITIKEILNILNLARGERLNLAGLLLFGKHPQRLKPVFTAKAVSFLGTDTTSTTYRDSEDMNGKLAELYQKTMAFLIRNLRKIQRDKDFNGLGDLELPKIVLQELLVNAMTHRDYFISAPVRVFIFDDRIEIINPVRLPNRLTITHIKSGNSIVRNPVLTSFGTKELPYRGLGTGIRRALKAYPDIEFINDVEAEQFSAS
ncbi:MAG: ATP-binding protein [bacterium]